MLSHKEKYMLYSVLLSNVALSTLEGSLSSPPNCSRMVNRPRDAVRYCHTLITSKPCNVDRVYYEDMGSMENSCYKRKNISCGLVETLLRGIEVGTSIILSLTTSASLKKIETQLCSAAYRCLQINDSLSLSLSIKSFEMLDAPSKFKNWHSVFAYR